jgi:hypothetical protein
MPLTIMEFGYKNYFGRQTALQNYPDAREEKLS